MKKEIDVKTLGKAPTKKMIHVRVEQDLFDALTTVAQEQGVTKTRLINALLVYGIDELRKNDTTDNNA